MNISQETFERLEHRHKIRGSETIYNELGISHKCEDLNYRTFTLIEFNNGSYSITDFNGQLIIELVEIL